MVSIGPILAVPGIADAIEKSDAKVIAVSPIIGDAPVKGPASQLLRGIGVEVSATGVAAHYAHWIDGFVFDRRDASQLAAIESLGLAGRAVETLMSDIDVARDLARVDLDLADELT